MKKRVEEEGEDESFVVVGLVWFVLICIKSLQPNLSPCPNQERERGERKIRFSQGTDVSS